MQDDEETTPPRQQIPTRAGVRVGRDPDEADLELARQLRETGSNPFVAVAQLARALAKLEEDSGSRQRDDATETLLELPKRVEKLEDTIGTGRKILYAIAGGLVSGTVYVAHVISESAERRGVETTEIRVLKEDSASLKQDIREIRRDLRKDDK